MAERSEMSDQELINEVVNSNKDAKRALLDRYFPQLFDYAARVNRDIQKGEEVISLAFRRIFEEICAGHEIKDFKTRIFHVVYTLSRDDMASKDVRDSVSAEFNLEPEFLQADPHKISKPSLLLHDSEIVELTWWVASNIEPAQYSALDLKYRQEFTSKEIADVLGIRTREVDVLLDRAKEFLNENLSTILIIGRDLGMDAGLQALAKDEKRKGLYYVPSLRVRNYVMGSDAYRKMIDKYPIGLEVFGALSNARPSFGAKLKIANYLVNIDAGGPADGVDSELVTDRVDTKELTETDSGNTKGFPKRMAFFGGQRLIWILGIMGLIGLVSLIVAFGIDANSTDDIPLDLAVVDNSVPPLEQTSSDVDLIEFNDVKFVSSSHMIGSPSEVMRITISWDYIDDMQGSVDDYVQNKVQGYSYFWDSNADSLPDRIIDIEQTVVEIISPTLSFGQWWFHIRSVDVDGNWSTPAHSGPYVLQELAGPTLEVMGEESTKFQQDSGIETGTDSISIVSASLVQEVASMESSDITSQITDHNENRGLSISKHEIAEMPKKDNDEPPAQTEQMEIEIELYPNEEPTDNGNEDNDVGVQALEEQIGSIDTETFGEEVDEANVVDSNAGLGTSESVIQPQTLVDQLTSDVALEVPENLQDVLDNIVPIATAGRNSTMLPPIPNFFSGTADVNDSIDPEGIQIIATIGGYGSNPVGLKDGSYKLLIIDPLTNDFYGEEITFWLIAGDKVFKAQNHAFFQEGNLSKGSESIFRTLNLEF